MADFQKAQPFLYYVKGAAFKEIRAKIVSPTIARDKQYGGRYDPWYRSYTWTTRHVQEPGKKYHAPIVTPDAELEPEHAAFYAAMYQQLRGRAAAQTIDDVPDEGQSSFEE